ncbi:hypothetical protein J4727_17785 [Providencia rettgeri]|uniref:Sodium/proton antiporter NhaB n=1 Tax=Providencia rettgeri TaxID=587 RepID=A0A939SJM7_PRORE|nr:hypothetical protein [Providencia rettgeri]
MDFSLKTAFENFLGNSPDWYKLAIIVFLIINLLSFTSSAPSSQAGY